MSNLVLYNSLTRKKEQFEPMDPPRVGMYTCGPTVYDRKHIGNFRTYTLSDLLVRVLQYNGLKVTHIMNFTDVGHLTGDNEGDADTGVDRLVKAAQRDRKTAWEVAETYTAQFIGDFEQMNLLKPEKFVKATDHIPEQIKLIEQLESNGLTYKISDGIYFDTKAYEQKTGSKYGELSTLDKIKEGARVEANPEKQNSRDFALWKFSPKGEKRDMEWESPWGVGFPGWHIECSAMSMKYLGETFDIHVGGEDLRSTHHPNEIAQSEGATGKKPFSKYWIHGAFILIDGERMSTSKGNNYNVGHIKEKGFDTLALRYLYLSTHYKKVMNFTWDSLENAQNSLNNLRQMLSSLLQKREQERTNLSDEKLEKIDMYSRRFQQAINDDLNTPQALAVMWEVVKSNIPTPDKVDLLYSFDEVLGLNLRSVTAQQEREVPEDIKQLMKQRDELRSQGKFEEADVLRAEIESKGFSVNDTKLNA